MARTPKVKELKNARLLKEYASWIYCTQCDATVAYLCYVTYDHFDFSFTCNCGSQGHVHICFDEIEAQKDDERLIKIKNRLCCPHDETPLLTIVDKNIKECNGKIACVHCSKSFSLQNE